MIKTSQLELIPKSKKFFLLRLTFVIGVIVVVTVTMSVVAFNKIKREREAQELRREQEEQELQREQESQRKIAQQRTQKNLVIAAVTVINEGFNVAEEIYRATSERWSAMNKKAYDEFAEQTPYMGGFKFVCIPPEVYRNIHWRITGSYHTIANKDITSITPAERPPRDLDDRQPPRVRDKDLGH